MGDTGTGVVTGEQKKLRKISGKRALILVLALIVVIALGVILIARGSGGVVEVIAPNADPSRAIVSQYNNNEYIAAGGIEYNAALTFGESTSGSALLGGKNLAALENNFLKKDGSGGDILVDETVYGRILKFNSDWIGMSLTEGEITGEEEVFDSLVAKGDAQEKLGEKADGAQVAFHNLQIGNIFQSGNDYYVLTNEKYTLAKDGTLSPYEGVYLYKLVPKGDTLLIDDYEAL
jgi:hypothetical protein